MAKKLKESNRRNYNRAIAVLILGVLILSWIMINAGEWLVPAILYIVLMFMSLLFYIIWDKF